MKLQIVLLCLATPFVLWLLLLALLGWVTSPTGAQIEADMLAARQEPPTPTPTPTPTPRPTKAELKWN